MFNDQWGEVRRLVATMDGKELEAGARGRG